MDLTALACIPVVLPCLFLVGLESIQASVKVGAIRSSPKAELWPLIPTATILHCTLLGLIGKA